MKRLEMVFRVLLAFCAIMVLVGGIWFLGDAGTYLALIFGGSTLFWVIAWDRTKLFAATGVAVFLSLLSSGLIFFNSFDASEFDVSIMKLAVLLVSSAACYIWFRRKVL